MTRALALIAIAACGDSAATSHDAAVTQGPEAVAIATQCMLPVGLQTISRLDDPYGTDPAQRFDLARPMGTAAFPLVVLIHGGGWSAGSKADFRDLMNGIASQGYVAASIEYRLVTATDNRFPTAVADVRCALRTLRSRKAQYAIDDSRVVAVGGSAGAHLAMMLGVAPEETALDDGTCGVAGSATVDGVVSIAGPADLRDRSAYPTATQPIVDAFFGHPPADDPAQAALASPITHVDASDPPTLFIHGTIDEVVPNEQSHLMQQALWAAHVPATVFEGAFGHTAPAPSMADATTITCTLAAFLTTITAP